MGCTSSKFEDLEALALCRKRCDLLAQAISHRYALADAHAAYSESLRSVGVALHRVVDGSHGAHPDNSPVLTLPGQRKGEHIPMSSLSSAPAPARGNLPPVATISAAHSHSRSQSGSHIHFHSDDSDSDDISPLHSDGDSPFHHHSDHHETLGGDPTYVNLHYSKSNPPPPSVSIEQRVGSPEHVQYGSVSEPPPSAYPYPYRYPTQNPNLYPYPFPYGYQPNYYGFLGSSSPPPAMSQSIPAVTGANSKSSTSRAAPPPPSPPRTSTWDFLNPFQPFDSYYHSPSRSSKDVREEEGIPDLEEDELEVIKEAYGDQKFAASTSAGDAPEQSNKSASVEKDDAVGNPIDSSSYHPKPKDDDVVVVEKNVVGDELQKPPEVRTVVPPRRYHNVSEVASEIRVQFEGAYESTKELAKMLEVGKHPYSDKGCASAVSSRMLCVIPVSISKDEDLVYVEDKVMSTGNLSSTLQKLYIWEHKLLDEIRVEEKLRLLHDRKSKKLQRLDERGAEAHKIDSTQKLIRKLSTQIMIAIQVVNTISTKINMLRDEELWPQIYELIQGLEKMWKILLGCHQIQYQAISESSYIDSLTSGGRLSDSHVSAVMQLELELLKWIANFSAWINLQKNFVKSLNSWLVLCLRYEPEVTADGIPPYSPGRIGAPPAFVIFNSWSQALDRVSENEVLAAMKSFASNVNQLWRPYDIELRQKMAANREMEKLHKMREREAQVIEGLNRKLVVNSAVHDDRPLSHLSEPGSLQSSLKHVFEAMESFSTNLMKAYEDIHARAEEEKLEEVKGSQG
ncbi:uncharacterized protein LOC110024414 [Phalaenopsis equestris]|uniref:uncharacterized protein LOC110024414 n=1 Tax=Phalaenopsis equestris TaxID=78828 RepID=UPI0009E19513|nr:uncharacterized protein LOC110024414 [Phalaenopsis equestris]